MVIRKQGSGRTVVLRGGARLPGPVAAFILGNGGRMRLMGMRCALLQVALFTQAPRLMARWKVKDRFSSRQATRVMSESGSNVCCKASHRIATFADGRQFDRVYAHGKCLRKSIIVVGVQHEPADACRYRELQ